MFFSLWNPLLQEKLSNFQTCQSYWKSPNIQGKILYLLLSCEKSWQLDIPGGLPFAFVVFHITAWTKGAQHDGEGKPSSRNRSQFQPCDHSTFLLTWWGETNLSREQFRQAAQWSCFESPVSPHCPQKEARKVNFVVQLPPTVANGLRHLLRLIKSLSLLYSCDIRRLQQPQTTQCSSRAHLNYDANLRHSALWANTGLQRYHTNLLYYSFPNCCIVTTLPLAEEELSIEFPE